MILEENLSPKANFKIKWADDAPKIIKKPKPNILSPNKIVSPNHNRVRKIERPRPNSNPRPNSAKRVTKKSATMKPRPQSAGKRKPSPRHGTLSKTLTTKRRSTPLGTLSNDNLSNLYNKLHSSTKNMTGKIFRSFDKEKENKKTTPVRAFK